MAKISFDDLKIGDFVLTTNNKVGEVIALKSYSYLNDKISKKVQKKEKYTEEELKKFKFDNTRHNGIWYAAVVVAIEDQTSSVPSYYVEGLDFIEIKEIVERDGSPKKQSVFSKIKNLFKKL